MADVLERPRPEPLAQLRKVEARRTVIAVVHPLRLGRSRCILVEADTVERVREQMNTLPLVRAEMLEVTIIPLKPYAGFSR